MGNGVCEYMFKYVYSHQTRTIDLSHSEILCVRLVYLFYSKYEVFPFFQEFH